MTLSIHQDPSISKEPKALLVVRICCCIDLLTGLFILTLPALFTELIYPLLSPYGILLAINLLGWWHLGRGLCLLFSPRHHSYILCVWLWLASVPFHVASLLLYALSWSSYLWHGFYTGLTFILMISYLKQKKRLLSVRQP